MKIQDNSKNPGRVQAGNRIFLEITQPVMKYFDQAPVS
jgi:hypothetical protein